MAMKRRAMKKTKVEIIPMIDTMFFLLVFFILSSVGVIKMQGIDINLPKAEPESTVQQIVEKKPDELVVAISPRGEVSVNNKPAPNGDIRKLLQSETEASIRNKKLNKSIEEALKEQTVILSADPAAVYGIMVNCMDQARSLGIRQFAIAALQADQTPSGQ
jgi:biopolymer transport protein ExbD